MHGVSEARGDRGTPGVQMRAQAANTSRSRLSQRVCAGGRWEVRADGVWACGDGPWAAACTAGWQQGGRVGRQATRRAMQPLASHSEREGAGTRGVTMAWVDVALCFYSVNRHDSSPHTCQRRQEAAAARRAPSLALWAIAVVIRATSYTLYRRSRGQTDSERHTHTHTHTSKKRRNKHCASHPTLLRVRLAQRLSQAHALS